MQDLGTGRVNRTNGISRLAISLVVTVLVCAVPGPLGAQDEAARPERGDYVPRQILVKFHEGARGYEVSAAARSVGAAQLRSFQSIAVQQWRLRKDVTVEQALAILSKNRNVEYAEPNYIVTSHDLPDDPLRGELWGLHNLGQTGGTPDADVDAPEAWDVATDASAVIVGVIDTGIDYTHPDLAANMWTNPG